jgi:hypothetical protein
VRQADAVTNLAHLLVPIQVDQVDGKLHKEAVHGFAGDNPQAVAGVQTMVLEQSRAALFAGIGELGRIGQNSVAGLVANDDFQAPYIARINSSIEAG